MIDLQDWQIEILKREFNEYGTTDKGDSPGGDRIISGEE